MPLTDHASLPHAELVARLQALERQETDTVRELRDVKAALDEHSIVAITDPAGKITYVNEKFCAISKYSREELLGQDHRIINSGHHPKSFFRDLWTTIGQGKVWHGEIKNLAKDGTYYWVDTTICPFLNDAGKPRQYVAIRTDITQRKADEEALQRLAAELAEKNKELEAIVYTVSHDLRSPLVNVQGFGKQLNRACESIRAAINGSEGGLVPAEKLKQPVEVAIPQALRFINAGVAKMEALLAGLLRYSRLGRVALSIKPINMNGLLAEILAAMKFQLDEAGADVRVETLPVCLGDAVQTSQVFANLIDNGIKYGREGGQVTLGGRAIAGSRVELTVRDDGPGIPSEAKARVFERFYRVDKARSREQGGTGLGLAIVKNVVQAHGGEVRIESGAGVGTTFFITLPAAKA